MKNSVKNTENVKNIMRDMKEKENDKSAQIEEVISGDMSKQESDFKKKLEEKRRKSALSTSDVMDQVNSIVKKTFYFFINVVLIFFFTFNFLM